ncbi:alkaline phosphatase precursor [Oxobacter pfennigii]|uniref:Alkaline phosphatase n=1 Tax=Oxobacter pfennigii TaxID=36849 RepID=A0A0P8WBJ5_9CLOT|nr:alkaline phosphatase [Oxobacter pfennigii]KPU45990.1 alkaline phosphatase precursor [Oxobacter pfennigii]
MVEISNQMFNTPQRPDVILGGGAQWFWPKSVPGSKRTDERDLIGDFEKEGYEFVGNAQELKNVDTSKTNQLLGLFHNTTINVYIDKAIEKSPDVLKNYPDQPMLWDMTKKSLDILSKNENSFFLMVEGASIDKQEHVMDCERAVWEINSGKDAQAAFPGAVMANIFDMLGQSEDVLAVVSYIVLAIAIITIVISLSWSILLRSRENAILRAIGAGSSDIFKIVIIESSIIIMISVISGFIFGHLLSLGIAMYMQNNT